jgi:hypothetical protein
MFRNKAFLFCIISEMATSPRIDFHKKNGIAISTRKAKISLQSPALETRDSHINFLLQHFFLQHCNHDIFLPIRLYAVPPSKPRFGQRQRQKRIPARCASCRQACQGLSLERNQGVGVFAQSSQSALASSSMQVCLGRAFLVFNATQGVGIFIKSAQNALAGEPSCLRITTGLI